MREIVLWRGLPGPAETFETSHFWGWRFILRAETLSESKYFAFLRIQKADSAGSGVILSTKQLSFANAGGTSYGHVTPKIRQCLKSLVDEKNKISTRRHLDMVSEIYKN